MCSIAGSLPFAGRLSDAADGIRKAIDEVLLGPYNRYDDVTPIHTSTCMCITNYMYYHQHGYVLYAEYECDFEITSFAHILPERLFQAGVYGHVCRAV